MEEFNHKHFNYKWTKGFGIAIFIALVLLVSSAYAQVVSGSVNTPSGYSIDSTTGNLIPYDSSLKTNTGTWTSTSGSGSGWVPYGSPQGSFNATDGYTFSYVGEELGISGVSLSSFAHGYQNTSAVFVTGFMYGLKYRFPCANQIGGNCTDTSGPQDTLRVEVGYYPASGAATFYTHQLGLKNQTDGNSAYNPIWQTLAETVTFAGAKTLTQAGSVNMGIYGMDAGFWACLMPDCYGPQVKDAYIRANYSVDPCILNPAFSPNCPGFSNVVQNAQSPLIWYGYNIATRLPHIGGGVQIHGFDYGFGYYAGDYCTNTFMFWCTSSSGANGGTINFKITDKFGNNLYSDSQYREGNYSGGSYSNRYLFTESQNSLNLGYIQWYATDVWGGNFQWSAYTRPIWSPDPCYEQPLYSKNCSNFQAEIKRLADLENDRQQAALAATVATVTSTATTPTSTVTTTINEANTPNPTVSVSTNPLPPPDRPPPEDSTSSRPPPPPPQTTSVAGAPVPREELRQETPRQESRDAAPRATVRVESTSDSTSMALNLIRQNQQRETAIASSASQNAMQTASISANASIRQAEAVAMDAVNRSQQSIQTQQQTTGSESIIQNNRTDQLLSIGPVPGSTSVVNLAIQQRSSQGQTIVDLPQQQSTASTSTSAVVQFNAMATTTVQPVQMFNPLQPPVFSQPAPIVVTPYTPPVQQQTFETRAAEQTQQTEQITNQNNLGVAILQAPHLTVTEVPTTSIPTAAIAPVITVDIPQTQTNFTTDRTNPINDILENKQVIPEQERKDTNTQTVKQNVQDNDAAVGVSIANIARTPVGFNSYMVALSDANFYTPKEIYRNQKTVDNARALRQLASDRLHQQMVDQQYLPR